MCVSTSMGVYRISYKGVYTHLLLSIKMMKRYNVAMTEEMEAALEKERRKRLLDSIPETIRTILSEHLAKS